MQQARRLALFPDTTSTSNNVLSIGGQDLAALAAQFGTPPYVYDRATMDKAVSDYKAALRKYYAGQAFITYAAKAFLCTAIARWADQRGLWMDCTGEGEISIALSGRLPSSRIGVHGVNKSGADLNFAVRNAATVVPDNNSEARRLQGILQTIRKEAHSDRAGEHVAASAARNFHGDASRPH
jgi:diaminopimelate decarboxylase